MRVFKSGEQSPQHLARARRATWLAISALGSLAIALAGIGCGEKSESVDAQTKTLRLALDFYPNPDHAGVYLAEQNGYFADAGLKVEISTPTDPSAPIKQVASGQADLAVSYQPEVALATQNAGLDVISIGALINRPLTSMIWLRRSRIGGIADLRGKTIATAGIPYQDAYLKTILATAGMTTDDVSVVNVGLGLLPALTGGRAAAILGGFSNIEGVTLDLKGEKPVVTPVDDPALGVPGYDELVLVARPGRLEQGPEVFRLFMQALTRGTKVATEDPEAATEAIVSANPDLDRTVTAAQVRATIPGLRPDGTHPYGYMDPARWKTFTEWMRQNGLISSSPDPSELLTNKYLDTNSQG